MKRIYSEPTVEMIEFNYRDQVVATSGIGSPPPIGSTYPR